MAETHDHLAAAQVGAYEMIDVRLFEHRMNIGEPFPADFAGTSLIRLAHCHLKVNCQAHFIAAQADVWNPGMASAPGMCRGVFAQRGEAEFLVLSMWKSLADHERYLRERFPSLRQRSGAANDLDAITGDLIDLEPRWTVPAEH